ncbi:MAG: hypothetical protein JO261_07400 [Alphaproteobacteria bacterium]|nr:hypothetical protein [Alphaproteobacteria bacterium]MBV9693507.1 hypothetical protein [Alphaproteobacteria bacterium]
MWDAAAPVLLSCAIVLALFFARFLWTIRGVPSDREKDAGTYGDHFVSVEDDGSVRELTQEEKDYLNTHFLPGDGNRPYIKDRYNQRTPDGKIGGFFLRRRVPRRVAILEA